MATPPLTSPASRVLAGPRWAALRTPRGRWISGLVGTAAGLLVLVAVLVTAGLDVVWRNWRSVEPAPLALYGLLTIGVYVLRAFRFRSLIGSGGIPTLCGVVSVHTLMVNLLPFSAGDVSYPVLLKRYRVRADLLGGVPSLVLSRVQDLLITGIFLLVALGLLGKRAAIIGLPSATPGHIGLALVALLGAATLAVTALRPSVRRGLQPFIGPVWLGIRNVGPAVWLQTLAVGLFARLVAIVAISYLFVAVGIGLPFSTVLVINSLYTLLPLLPVNAVAGLGITQAYLVTCFVASGLDRGVATAASVQIHGLQLSSAALLAALGYLQLQRAAAGARDPGPGVTGTAERADEAWGEERTGP